MGGEIAKAADGVALATLLGASGRSPAADGVTNINIINANESVCLMRRSPVVSLAEIDSQNVNDFVGFIAIGRSIIRDRTLNNYRTVT